MIETLRRKDAKVLGFLATKNTKVCGGWRGCLRKNGANSKNLCVFAPLRFNKNLRAHESPGGAGDDVGQQQGHEELDARLADDDEQAEHAEHEQPRPQHHGEK